MVFRTTESRLLAAGMLLATAATTTAFTAPVQQRHQGLVGSIAREPVAAYTRTSLAAESSDDEEEKPVNPYADPNYPELEFVNYDDPEYVVDQGTGDEFFDTEAEVEAMREDRRVRNDEYQKDLAIRVVLESLELSR